MVSKVESTATKIELRDNPKYKTQEWKDQTLVNIYILSQRVSEIRARYDKIKFHYDGKEFVLAPGQNAQITELDKKLFVAEKKLSTHMTYFFERVSEADYNKGLNQVHMKMLKHLEENSKRCIEKMLHPKNDENIDPQIQKKEESKTEKSS